MTIPIWPYAWSMPAYMAFLFAVNEVARRHVKVFVFLQAILLATVPFWLRDISGSWFQVSKVLTTTVPCLVLSLVRIAFQESERTTLRFLRQGWTFVFAYMALQINIVEAVAADFQAGRHFNALSGFVLGLTMANPFKDKAWIIETDTPRREALVRVSTEWTVLYTSWNLACLYAEYPQYLAHVACLLMVPLAYSVILGRPELWMGARVYTLSFAVIILWGGHDFVTPLMDTAAMGDERAVNWWGIANCITAAGYLTYRLARRAVGLRGYTGGSSLKKAAFPSSLEPR
jgi:uncharacterized protein DUF5692